MLSIAEVVEACSAMGSMDPDYYSRMMHHVPATQVVDRVAFILNKCKDRRVVNFGSSSGLLHDRIKDVASEAFGVDKEGEPDFRLDLDNEFLYLHSLPLADIYVAGEIIEHLTNPGNFLRRLRIKMNGDEKSELIVTVPNAFAEAGAYWMRKSYEQINKSHVSWYSYWTITTLVTACGFKVRDWYWYNGRPLFAEGLILVCDPELANGAKIGQW